MRARHLAWLLGLAACYSPNPPEGAPCQIDDNCPHQQRCLAGSCRVSPLADDASTDGRTPIDSATDAPPGTMIDAPTDAPVMGCTSAGFSCTNYNLNSCNGLCFIRCKDVVTRTEAASRCAAWSGTLAVFDSAAAMTCAVNNVPPSWIGLTQGGIVANPTQGWSWNGGPAISFTAWNTGQPDDGDGIEDAAEQCGIANGSGWDDSVCTGDRGFICRR